MIAASRSRSTSARCACEGAGATRMRSGNARSHLSRAGRIARACAPEIACTPADVRAQWSVGRALSAAHRWCPCALHQPTPCPPTTPSRPPPPRSRTQGRRGRAPARHQAYPLCVEDGGLHECGPQQCVCAPRRPGPQAARSWDGGTVVTSDARTREFTVIFPLPPIHPLPTQEKTTSSGVLRGCARQEKRGRRLRAGPGRPGIGGGTRSGRHW